MPGFSGSEDVIWMCKVAKMLVIYSTLEGSLPKGVFFGEYRFHPKRLVSNTSALVNKPKSLKKTKQ